MIEVPRISKKRVTMIQKAWEEQKSISTLGHSETNTLGERLPLVNVGYVLSDLRKLGGTENPSLLVTGVSIYL